MDSLHVDNTINHFSDDFDTKKFAKQFKAFKDEMQQVIKQCNALIERNTVEMGGVWNLSQKMILAKRIYYLRFV